MNKTAAECEESPDGAHLMVRRRDGKRCAYCGLCQFGDSTLTPEEIQRIREVEAKS